MSKKLIDICKDPEQAQALGILIAFQPDRAALIEEAGPENCLWYAGECGWKQAEFHNAYNTYIIKPDWEPKPEFVDREVTTDARGFLVVQIPKLEIDHFLSIAGCYGTFSHWECENGEVCNNVNEVQTEYRTGRKVVARFRPVKP